MSVKFLNRQFKKLTIEYNAQHMLRTFKISKLIDHHSLCEIHACLISSQSMFKCALGNIVSGGGAVACSAPCILSIWRSSSQLCTARYGQHQSWPAVTLAIVLNSEHKLGDHSSLFIMFMVDPHLNLIYLQCLAKMNLRFIINSQ